MSKERAFNPQIQDIEGSSDHIQSQMQASSAGSDQIGGSVYMSQMGAEQLIRAHKTEAPLAVIVHKEENRVEEINNEQVGRVLH